MHTTTHLLQGLIARGWTQTEINRRTGIPQPRLSKWARGKAPSGADDALKLKELADSGEVPAKRAEAQPAADRHDEERSGEATHDATVTPPAPDRASIQTAGETI